MVFIKFLIQTVLISLSGVMAPGPVTAVTVGKGSDSPHAGAFISIGHGIVEFPLMIALFFGFGVVLEIPFVKSLIAILGGAFLFWMGIGMLKEMKTARVEQKKDNRSPILLGIVLSAGNPYFLLWWATVGVTLILRSVGFGFWGFMIFAFVHWMCDLVWLYFLSVLSYKGGEFFGKKFQVIVFGVCGVVLIIFSVLFVKDGLSFFFRSI